jgi:hypothetical protein
MPQSERGKKNKGGYEFSEADVVVGVPATLMALARAAVPEVS